MFLASEIAPINITESACMRPTLYEVILHNETSVLVEELHNAWAIS
jgi:hypothetical protein